MSKKKLSKLLALYLPYVVIGLLATNLGEAWRLAAGKELGDKIVSLMDTLPAAFSNPLPSLRPFDLFIGLCCGAGMRLAVYLKGKNAKKYRHGMEYGSARWGTPKDIEPFMAPKFADNIILTKTERLMMSNRPPDPKNARNKNVLVVGGSGSGKTRFFIKPNLLQCDSKNFPVSFVVTDPKGSIGVECGEALLKHGYKLKFFNTINFSKSMRYNPMAYIHSEKDVLKLVTALMTNTKGERKQAEEDAKKAAKEAAASGSEQTGGNKVTKYAATFLGVLALVGLVAGGGIYTFMKQKQKKQAEKEALDPDANYTEDKGDFEIPTEDEPEETGEEDTEPI